MIFIGFTVTPVLCLFIFVFIRYVFTVFLRLYHLERQKKTNGPIGNWWYETAFCETRELAINEFEQYMVGDSSGEYAFLGTKQITDKAEW